MPLRRSFGIDILGIVSILASLLCGCEGNPNAGVVGTGNAGRIRGVVQLEGSGVLAATRLLRVHSESSQTLVDTRSTDSSGVFSYDSLPAGDYRVEAWQEGTLVGKSSTFHLGDATKNLVIVMVRPVIVHLDLRALGDVDSAYLDYPGNPVLKTDSFLTIRNFLGDSGILHARTRDASGARFWLTWVVSSQGGTVRLSGLHADDSVAVASVDSGAFFPDHHTMALWTFDSVDRNGRVRDLGPFHNDLVMPSGRYLVEAPHGKAVDFRTLPLDPAARVAGTALSESLRWWNTRYQTVRFRIKVDERPRILTKFLGTFQAFQVGVNSDLQIELHVRMQVEPGAWEWNYYLTNVGFVELGKWMDITISRDASDRSMSIWKDGAAAPLFQLLAPPVPAFKEISLDTFGLGNSRWNRGPSAILLDELEISDTLRAPAPLPSQPTSPVTIGHRSGEMVVYSFADSAIDGQGPAIDSGDTIRVGSNRPLYVKIADLSTLVDRNPVATALTLYFGDNLGFQEFAVYRASASFEERIAKGLAPRRGIDYSTEIGALGYVYGSRPEFVGFSLTAPVKEWAGDPRTNHGMVILPTDAKRPDRRILRTGTLPAAYNVYLQ